jgi:predicted permease
MTRLRVLGSRLVALFFRRRRDRELDDEIQAHLNALTDDYVRGGMPLAEARAAARREFGALGQMKETYRDQRGVPPVETILQDLRYGARMLRRSPGFTAVAVLSLGLGIGANTAVFTFLNALLLRSLPVPHPEELVEVAAQRRGDFAALSYPIYRGLRTRQQVFTDVLASAGETPYRLTIRQATGGAAVLDNMRVAFVSGNYFTVLGLQPAIGRLIAETDDLDPGSSETAGSVIVISDGFWQRQFGRDPGVLGGSILVGRSRCTIIGVAPGQFLGESVGAAAVGWVPLVPFSDRSDLENRRAVFADYVARLRPGMSRERAQTEATGLFRQMLAGEDGLRGSISDYTISLRPAGTGTDLGLRRQFAMPFRIVMGVVSLVLLIACANVANLLLERAMSRRGEISVRLAIGCSRARLVRQLMTESALLSTLGALAGAALAYGGSRLLPRLIDSGAVPVRLDVSPDSYVLMFLVAISLLAGLGFGLVPAFRSTRVNVAASLQSARRGDGRSPGGRVNRAMSTTASILARS